MSSFTLDVIEQALRSSWAADTCSPDDVARAAWDFGNPAWGHCDITALVVQDVFGGDLMLGDVYLVEEQRGYHWWNRLPDGAEVDLTLEQFRLGETVTNGRVVRPVGPLRRRVEEYELLRRRVADHVGRALPVCSAFPRY
ncbi:YunG family protein [Nocardia brasiliensis]|uniref:YunG family protein n=1 Tax=Nocardia brasiliensis TaxID=37326 RepID=UPI002453E718|nr:hypothetical protein [Nocardia brasiliensis]